MGPWIAVEFLCELCLWLPWRLLVYAALFDVLCVREIASAKMYMCWTCLGPVRVLFAAFWGNWDPNCQSCKGTTRWRASETRWAGVGASCEMGVRTGETRGHGLLLVPSPSDSLGRGDTEPEGTAVRIRTSEPGRFHDGSQNSWVSSRIIAFGSDGGSHSYLRTSLAVRTFSPPWEVQPTKNVAVGSTGSMAAAWGISGGSSAMSSMGHDGYLYIIYTALRSAPSTVLPATGADELHAGRDPRPR